MAWQVALNRRFRLMAVLVWSIAGFVWLLVPELIMSFGPVAGGFSEVGEFRYRVTEIGCFVIVEGIVGYLLLGSRQREAADNHYFKPLVQDALVGAAYAEPTGIITYANAAFLRVFDLSSTVLGQLSLMEVLRGWSYTAPASGLFPRAGRVEVWARTTSVHGMATELLVAITPARDELEGFLLSVTDVTEKSRLQRAEALLGGILNFLPDGVIVCDGSRAGLPIVFANKSAQTMTGFSEAELLDMYASALRGPERNQPGIAKLRTALEQKQDATASIHCYRKDGSYFDCTVRLSTLLDAAGKVTHVTYSLTETTDEVEARNALARELYRDPISGLRNRAGFVRELTAMLAAQDLFLVKADIQNFHELNTALGWDVGDALLNEMGRRLTETLPDAVLGRLESNQYGIALPIGTLDICELLELIRNRVSSRYQLQGCTCDPVVSIGHTVAHAGSSIRAILQQASVALNEARENRGGQTKQFDRNAEARISERRRLTTELQQAVLNGDFAVHYQPKVDLTTGRIIGAEALARWYHPLFGVQQASAFIALAEETGSIVDIGRVVINEAVQFGAKLNRNRGGSIPVAVNVSAIQLARMDFVTTIERALEEAGALPAWLCLELTEMRAISSSPETMAIIDRLHAMGVRLGIDDFGTGYSSLSNMNRVPLSEIKIASCFVSGAGHSGLNRAVIKAVLSIGAAKGAQVVAVGVETEIERETLLDLGCTMGQGFLFGQAVPASEFEALVALGVGLTASAADAVQMPRLLPPPRIVPRSDGGV